MDEYIQEQMKRMIKSICRWKGFEVESWHIGEEHIHLYISIPPKYSISYALKVLKSKTSGWIRKKTKKLPKGSVWARGYFVSTVGINEIVIKKYIQSHGKRRKIEDVQLGLLTGESL